MNIKKPTVENGVHTVERSAHHIHTNKATHAFFTFFSHAITPLAARGRPSVPVAWPVAVPSLPLYTVFSYVYYLELRVVRNLEP